VPASGKSKEKTAMASDTKDAESPRHKTDGEWKKTLTPEQYRVTRKKGTEAPFSGEYYRIDKQGVYHCVCCGAALFSSETKFDAHCGWPSFWDPIDKENIKFVEDRSHGMHRVEVQCKNCGAHLGHVFDDGPHPTGQRYCINSVSLKLEETGNKGPQEEKGRTAADRSSGRGQTATPKHP
jgi:peptide-methionine (R)-S-oxide reductase